MKSPPSPHQHSPQKTSTRTYQKKNGQGKFLSSLSRDDDTFVVGSCVGAEHNARARMEDKISRVARFFSFPFARTRGFFVFFFSRRAAVVDFSLRKTARERSMRTSLARLDDSNVLICCVWMDSGRICAFSLLSSVSFGEMHFSFFPFRCRFRFADRALVGSADMRFTFAALVSTQSRSFTIIKIVNVVFFPFYASISTERSKESQIWDTVLLPGG